MTDEPLQWASPLVDVAMAGPDAVRDVAEAIRAERTAEEADALGLRLLDLLTVELANEVLGIFAALPVLAGPKSIAGAGGLLRREPNCTRHSARYALSLLRESRTIEGVIQLALCARNSPDSSVCKSAIALFQARAQLVRRLSDVCSARVPTEDLAQFLSHYLERAMLDSMRWDFRDFERAVGSTAHEHLRRAVFARFAGPNIVEPFMLDPEAPGMTTADLDPLAFRSTAVIGVPHPRELEPDTWAQYGLALADFELVELFRQFGRDSLEQLPFETELGYELLGVPVKRSHLEPFLFAEGWQFAQNDLFRCLVRGVELELALDGLGEDTQLAKLTIRVSARTLTGAGHSQLVLTEFGAARATLLEAFAPELLSH